jgi:hypothetical protein
MHIEFQVEEASMEAALAVLAPRLVRGRASWRIINYQSKPRLLRELPRRLAGYQARLRSESLKLLVLVDRDADDCVSLKGKLEHMAQEAGLATKSRPAVDGLFAVVNRIAVEELEAWFFGDIAAVREAYPRISPTLHRQRPYRAPDAIAGGTWEALHRTLRQAGHLGPVYPKIETARSIAQHMLPERNRSPSFRTFCDGVAALLP